MSDLHCPATLVVARHAKAAFVETWFSDEGGSLTSEGRTQAAALADSLHGRRVAAVWCSDASRSVQTAEIAAARLGVAVTARKSLREVFIGDLMGQSFDYSRIEAVCEQWYAGSLDARFEHGESGADVVARHRAELEEIADLHRGETVLVIGHQTALGLVVPTLVPGLSFDWTRSHELANTESIELEHDADGWVLRRWGGLELGR
ncbi:histidine phosphatase family protein [Marmoricola sp. URHB0036]|uniref:histidine phosphatase family protein n=1 Tax=Marmoricola sp. URHB0036 TaxID=1298863 RepID=UPI000419F3A3|nr:histidine phosphatase family protein [Marmoricola sp. URHB0036]